MSCIKTKKIINEKKFQLNVNKCFRHEVSKNKLNHDIQQIAYLLKKKLIPNKFKKIITKYKLVYNALPKEADTTDIFTLSEEYTKKLGATFNNIIYYETGVS